MTQTRLVTLDDASRLSELLLGNRAFLSPWEPEAPAERLTPEGQRTIVSSHLRSYADGWMVPLVIVAEGEVIGRVTLSSIMRFPMESCTVGYWLGEAHTGQGHATKALGQACRVAFEILHVHRVEAGTLPHNLRSQAVLERNGFTRYGLAPGYLKIAGRWQDHVLFQRLNDAV